jgi:4-amino-4-deoxy-L-arabinose transferase-like glycosyltransferase
MELFSVDLMVAFCIIASLGFVALLKQKKFGLSFIMVATAGLLILSPFTEQILFVPLYVILAIIAWLIFRQIGKPIPVKKK